MHAEVGKSKRIGPKIALMAQSNSSSGSLDKGDKQRLRWEANRLLDLLNRVPYIEGDYITINWVWNKGGKRREGQVSRMYRREPANRQVLLCQTPIRKYLETEGPLATFRIRVWRFKGKSPAGGVHCQVILDASPEPQMPSESSAGVSGGSGTSETSPEPSEPDTAPRKRSRRTGATAKLRAENGELKKELHTLRWEVQTLRRQLRLINHHLKSLESSLEPGTEPV